MGIFFTRPVQMSSSGQIFSESRANNAFCFVRGIPCRKKVRQILKANREREKPDSKRARGKLVPVPLLYRSLESCFFPSPSPPFLAGIANDLEASPGPILADIITTSRCRVMTLPSVDAI